MIRTAGIDFDMGRVVICSVPLEGDGIREAIFTEELVSRDASIDLAQRYKTLHAAARTAWGKHISSVPGDVVSACVERPGGAQAEKLYGAFAAVCAGTPTGMALCSMYASEWKSTLKLPMKKEHAHDVILERYSGQWVVRVDEHALDAMCLSLAWRQLQVNS